MTGAFFGSFRFGEILCSSPSKFVEDESLLWKDIIFKEDSVLIKIKIPKSRNAKGVTAVAFPDYKRLAHLRGLGG